jgi:hypothetical protein
MGSLTEDEIEIYREEILGLHRQSIEAHLVKDVDFLVKDVSEDFMSVNNGRISYSRRRRVEEFFYLLSKQHRVLVVSRSI